MLFDYSGTLFDDGAVLTPAGVCAQAARRGVALEPGEAERVIAGALAAVDSPSGLAAREGCDRSAARHRAVWTGLMAESAPGALADAVYACLVDPGSWPAYPDAAGVLRRLAGAGLRLGVVSNIGWDVRPSFAALGVAHLVGSFALSCERGAVKPEPELFLAACEELGVAPERTLFVGDDPVKDGAAARLGMPVYLLPGERSAGRPRGLAAVSALAGVVRG
ncbi:HAD family hydrolase [Streptomyces sp. NPDC127098]|uniref:HAD family hydrolase n=1 Tax=Streptomyces sp. NPDC127098 TaxID=3347137 RepID=UPI003666C375